MAWNGAPTVACCLGQLPDSFQALERLCIVDSDESTPFHPYLPIHRPLCPLAPHHGFVACIVIVVFAIITGVLS